MKKTYGLSVMGLALATIFSGCHGGDKKTDTERAMTVDVAMPVVDSVVLHKTYPGYLAANQAVQLVARVDGYLMSHPFEGGSFFKKGTILFTIEDKSYRDAVAKAEAELADAKSTYQYASSQYEAMKEAYESDAVSQMEVLQAKNSMETAAADIKSTEASLRTARTTLGYCTVTAPCDGHVTCGAFDLGTYLAGSAPIDFVNP